MLMKRLLAALFATSLLLAACGGSGSDDGDAAADTTETPATDDTTEATDDGNGEAADADSTTTDTTEATETTEDDAGAGENDDVTPDDVELDADGLALLAAMNEAQAGEDVFEPDEISCANAAIIERIGVEQLNSYGITVDNPDDSQLPEEYEVQAAAVDALTDCISFGAVFSRLSPGCDLSELTEADYALAIRHDFLSEFDEYVDEGGQEASAKVDAATAAC